jgi:hypothetical protein
MKYKEAAESKDKDNLDDAVFEEHEHMVKIKVWKAVPRKEVPLGSHIMSSTWATKQKSNGK